MKIRNILELSGEIAVSAIIELKELIRVLHELDKEPIFLPLEMCSFSANNKWLTISRTKVGRKILKARMRCSATGSFHVSAIWSQLRDLLGISFYDRYIEINIRFNEGAFFVDRYAIFIDESITHKNIETPSLIPFYFEKININTQNNAQNNYWMQMLKNRIAQLDQENKHNIIPSVEIALRYERDRRLSRLLKIFRGPNCQICGFSFKTKSGEHYSECHHLEHLASGGLDISKNMLIVCANCHRQFHFGNVKIIEHTTDHIRIDIDGNTIICELKP